jgi:hypothetical protein
MKKTLPKQLIRWPHPKNMTTTVKKDANYLSGSFWFIPSIFITGGGMQGWLVLGLTTVAISQ